MTLTAATAPNVQFTFTATVARISQTRNASAMLTARERVCASNA